jgi:hypothetical protein
LLPNSTNSQRNYTAEKMGPFRCGNPLRLGVSLRAGWHAPAHRPPCVSAHSGNAPSRKKDGCHRVRSGQPRSPCSPANGRAVSGSAPLRGRGGFDRAAFCGTPGASERKASRHINPSPPAQVEQKGLRYSRLMTNRLVPFTSGVWHRGRLIAIPQASHDQGQTALRLPLPQ